MRLLSTADFLISALVCAYGLVFLHLAAFTAATKDRARVHCIFAALLLDYGLMCLVGGAGAVQDHPESRYYIGTFAFLLLLAPLGSAYIMAFLGSEHGRRRLAAIAAATVPGLAAGILLGTAGLSWYKVLSAAYAYVFIVLAAVGALVFGDIAPIRTLSRNLKSFFWCYWGVALQVFLLSVFQFLELKPAVHALWMLTTLTMVVHSLMVSRNPEVYRQYEAQTESLRQGKSRLNGVNVKARLALLHRAMAEEKLYRVPTLRIEDLAAKVDLSGPQLSELLNRHLGKSFTAYVNELRIEEARKALVASPKLGILDIGYNCGFSSKSSFNAVFRKATGLASSEFRNRSLSAPAAALSRRNSRPGS